MNQSLIEENKQKLEAEKIRLQEILSKEKIDDEIPGGHIPAFTEVGSEEGENASESEQFGNELSVSEDMSARLQKVEAALLRIEEGSYGKCLVGGEEIDEARLTAEPAAETCVAHANA
jgi:DnaK suppressor protein